MVFSSGWEGGREGKKGARDRGWKKGGRESKNELIFINFLC
jgi:hypothetical protein